VISSPAQEGDETQLQTAYKTTMHGLEMENMQQALELSLPKLDCAALAALASSSSPLSAAVLTMVTNRSTASYLLCKTVRDAAVHEAGADRKQHNDAIRWLLALQRSRAADHLQGTTAAALLSTPFVPYATAAALAAAGLRLSYQQVVDALHGQWLVHGCGSRREQWQTHQSWKRCWCLNLKG
jgi:hypothetical protein